MYNLLWSWTLVVNFFFYMKNKSSESRPRTPKPPPQYQGFQIPLVVCCDVLNPVISVTVLATEDTALLMLETTSVIPSKTLAVENIGFGCLDKVLFTKWECKNAGVVAKKERKTIPKDTKVTEKKDLVFTPLTPIVLFWNKRRIISPSTFLLQYKHRNILPCCRALIK